MDGALAMGVDDADGATAGNTHSNAELMEILMDDDELDDMADLAVPVAAQISHSQIIEKQAHTIAKFEKQVTKAQEYKTLTKVKLKEAALRLREYRLRVESLMKEVDALKKQTSKLQSEQLQSTTSVAEAEQAAAIGGRGKGGRGRGRGARGRGRGGSSSSRVEAPGKSASEVQIVDVSSVGIQTDEQVQLQDTATQSDSQSVKMTSDAQTQTIQEEGSMPGARTETCDAAVQTQIESRKGVESASQSMITGDIQPVRAATNISAGSQTDQAVFAEHGCQCDLLPVEESMGRVFNGDLERTSDERAQASGDDIVDIKSGASRKRKRSFGTIGRGEKPKPSALVASMAEVGVSEVDHLEPKDEGCVSRKVSGAATCIVQSDESGRMEEREPVYEEKKRAETAKKSRLQQRPDHPGISGRSNRGASTTEVEAMVAEDQACKPESEEAMQPLVAVLSTTQTQKSDPDRPPSAEQRVASKDSQVDAVSAAIDAELDFSESDEDDIEKGGGGESVAATAEQGIKPLDAIPLRTVVAFDAAMCNEIDEELDFGSSSEGEEDNGKQDTAQRAAGAISEGISLKADAVSAAIDDELASISDAEEDDEGERDSTRLVPVSISNGISAKHDAVGAAIDDELASSSDEEEGEREAVVPDTAMVSHRTSASDDAVGAAIDDELASSSDEVETEREAVVPDTAMVSHRISAKHDAVGAAIDDELASSSDEEEGERDAVVPDTAVVSHRISASDDAVGAAIDDELASSSEEDGEQLAQLNTVAVSNGVLLDGDDATVAVDDESVSRSGGESEKSSVVEAALTAISTGVSEKDGSAGAVCGGELAIRLDGGNEESELKQSSVTETVLEGTSGAGTLTHDKAASNSAVNGAMQPVTQTPTVIALDHVAVGKDFSQTAHGIDSPTTPTNRLLTGAHAAAEAEIDAELGSSDSDNDNPSVAASAMKEKGVGKLNLSGSSSSDDSDSSDSDSGSDSEEEDDGVDAFVHDIELEMTGDANPLVASPSVTKRKDHTPQTAASTEGLNSDVSREVSLPSPDTETPSEMVSTAERRAGQSTMVKLTPVQLALVTKRDAKTASVSVARIQADNVDAPEVDGTHKSTTLKKRARNEPGDEVGGAEKRKMHSTTEDSSKGPKTPGDDALSINSEASSCPTAKSETNERSSKRPRLLEGDGQCIDSATPSSPATRSEGGSTVKAEEMEDGSKSVAPATRKPKSDKGKDQHAKYMAAFQHGIARLDNETEKVDEHFVYRTLKVLVKSSAKYVVSQPELVTRLCNMLVAEYRAKRVSPVVFVHGACRVFQSPKFRHLIETESLGVSSLAHRVLLGLVGNQCIRNEVGVHAVNEADRFVLEECLVVLRSLLLAGRAIQIQRAMSSLSQTDARSQLHLAHLLKSSISRDKVFLAYVCTFYARVCKSLDLDECLRVLVFDLLRRYPNIKGLYLTRAIVEVAPEILQIEYDDRGHEKEVLVKETMQHALTVVEVKSARSEEVLLHESSLEIMHRILECIDAFSLRDVNAEDPAYGESFADKVWSKYITPTTVRKRLPTTSDDDSVFEVCKSLELLAAVYESEQMVELFPLQRFQDACGACEDGKGKARIAKMVGAIACAFAEMTKSTRPGWKGGNNSLAADSSNDKRVAFVNQVSAWLQQQIAQVQDSPTEPLDFQLACASVCVDLIVVKADTPPQRRHILHTVLRWFRTQSQEQQMLFPAGFLRQLRLLTVSSCPLLSAANGTMRK